MNQNTDTIAQVVVGLPVEGPFDYFVPENFRDELRVGMRVRVSFNRQKRIGFVVGFVNKSLFKTLNPILETCDRSPCLDANMLALAKKLSEYYGCSFGEAVEAALPQVLRKGKAIDRIFPSVLNENPQEEKKTLVYDRSSDLCWEDLFLKIKLSLDDQRSVIVLVPEISRLIQIAKKLNIHFSSACIVFDHDLKPQEELDRWIAARSKPAQIILGTRSAIFIPVCNLGLIIVDGESHEAYKQEQMPHYHAREVALWRAGIEKCQLVFTSSAPSAEVYALAQKEEWQIVKTGLDKQAQLKIVDMTNYNPAKTGLISFPLQAELQQGLEKKKKFLLFLNKRGFSSMTRCQDCGFVIKCERCSLPMTYLYSKKTLICHHCNEKKELPKFCPQCKTSYLSSTGSGIEKLESNMARFYPQAKISHFDKDTEELDLRSDIVIATQAILKFVSEKKFDTVAVLNFDAQLNISDYRSGSRLWSLLAQLRTMASEKFYIQTQSPDNYCIKAIQKDDPEVFYKEELKARRQIGLPPYEHLIAVTVRGENEQKAFEQSGEIYQLLRDKKPQSMEIMDLHNDIIFKLRGKYRYNIVLKVKDVIKGVAFVKKSLKAIRRKSGNIVTIDVDP